MQFREALGRRVMVFDGAMGTMLALSGLMPGEQPERMNERCPDAVSAIHRAYLHAGCQLIKTNTFGANGLKFDPVAPVVQAGVALARRAVRDSGADALVALDIGPTGQLVEPLGDLAFEAAVDLFAEAARAGADAGADLILIETMCDTREIKAAVLGARAAGLPIVVTASFDQRGRLLSGADIPAVAALLNSLGVDAMGFNCGLGPRELLHLVPQMCAAARAPIVVNPNAGLPVQGPDGLKYLVGPEAFARDIAALTEMGAAVVGGCCGTTPEHLAAVASAVKGRAVNRADAPIKDEIASGRRAVALEDHPVIAEVDLSSGDWEDAIDDALDALSGGADAIRLIHPPTDIATGLTAIQSVVDAPLILEAEGELWQAASRACNGVLGRPGWGG